MINITKQLEADAKKGINGVCKEVKRKIKDQALKSAEAFYAAYSSPDYKRTFGLTTAYTEIDEDGGLSRTVGVEFNAEFIATWHKVSNDFIFDTAWENGFHGNPDYPGTVQTISPKQYMDQKFSVIKSQVPGLIQRHFSRVFK